MDLTNIFENCVIDGNVVKLPPGQLDRDVYLKVKKSFEIAGGKWKGGKVGGFVFEQDPTKLLSLIAGGEKVNDKQKFQFFETPDSLADELVELAEIEEKHSILEPSAGRGAIVKAINRTLPNKIVDCFELMELNRNYLQKITNVNLIGLDFIEDECLRAYDRIIANPPFQKNQDIIHLQQMYDYLNPEGRVVCITSKHWEFCNNKREKLFRDWLDEVGASVEDIPSGAFKESGTTVGGKIVIIDK